jgi:hypothetical protein
MLTAFPPIDRHHLAEIRIDFGGPGDGVPLVGKIVGNVIGFVFWSGGSIASVFHEYMEDSVVVFVVIVGVEGDADAFEIWHGLFLSVNQSVFGAGEERLYIAFSLVEVGEDVGLDTATKIEGFVPPG